MDYQEQLKRMGKYEEPKVNAKEEPNKQIDWEQRRYEIAKDVMASIILANTQYRNGGIDTDYYYDTMATNRGIANIAVMAADALIETLQQGK